VTVKPGRNSVDAELPLGTGLPEPEAPADGELVPALEEADAPGDPDGVGEGTLADADAPGDADGVGESTLGDGEATEDGPADGGGEGV